MVFPMPHVKGRISYRIYRCQYQPASFSSVFKLSGTACLVGAGLGGVWFSP